MMSSSVFSDPHWSINSIEQDELRNPFQFSSPYSTPFRHEHTHEHDYDSTSEDYTCYAPTLLNTHSEDDNATFLLSTPPLSPQLILSNSFDNQLNISLDCQDDISNAIGQLAFERSNNNNNNNSTISEHVVQPCEDTNIKIESTSQQVTCPINPTTTTGSILITKGIKDVQDDVYVVNFEAGFEATISLITPINTSTKCDIIITIEEIEELVIKKIPKTPKSSSTKSSSTKKKKSVKQLVEDVEIDEIADAVGENANYFDLQFKPNSSMQRIDRSRWADTVKIDSPLSFPSCITSECTSIAFSGCMRRPIGRYNDRMGSQIPPSRMTVSMKSISDDGNVINHSWSTIIRGGRRADDKKSTKRSPAQATSSSSSSLKTPRKRGAKRTSSSSDESATEEQVASPKRRRSIE